MMTNGERLLAHARQLDIRPRSVSQVQCALENAEKHGGMVARRCLARMMTRYGNLTEEARAVARLAQEVTIS